MVRGGGTGGTCGIKRIQHSTFKAVTAVESDILIRKGKKNNQHYISSEWQYDRNKRDKRRVNGASHEGKKLLPDHAGN